VPPDRVSAKCERGWVTLSGEVDRAYQKSSAEADVRNVRGVVGVTNEITVASSAKTEASRRDEAMLLAGAIGPIAEERKRAEGRRASLS
jgi:osmotically-inducible protein OsmY